MDDADPPLDADRPLDAADPRGGAGTMPPRAPRRLVRSAGPGPPADDRLVGRLHVAIRVVAAAGVALVVAVFFIGLDPGRPVADLGPEAAVLAAVADGPRRVCVEDAQPCAWLSVVDGALLALSTAGPLREEQGRAGVGWCPSSGGYLAPNSGSRFDARGRVVDGPAPRGLDAYAVDLVDGAVRVDFAALRTGLQAFRTTETVPPTGPPCTPETLPPPRDLPVADPA